MTIANRSDEITYLCVIFHINPPPPRHHLMLFLGTSKTVYEKTQRTSRKVLQPVLFLPDLVDLDQVVFLLFLLFLAETFYQRPRCWQQGCRYNKLEDISRYEGDHSRIKSFDQADMQNVREPAYAKCIDK